MKTKITSAAVFFCALLFSSLALADDIDLYTNPPTNTVAPPATILVLDLNLLGVCDNVLTDSGSATPVFGGLNPFGGPACVTLQTQTLANFLTTVGTNPTSVLTTALNTLGPNGLCSLYATLGITSPTIPIPIIGGTLGCGTVGSLITTLSPATLTAFTTALVAGLQTALQSTAINKLPSAVTSAVSTALSAAGIPALLVDPTSITNLSSVLGGILNNLINSKVAIVVSHSNRGAANSVQGPDPYICSFADRASIPSPRQTTVGCSNGGYFLIGFTPLVDGTSVTALLARINSLLTAAVSPTNLLTTLSGISLNTSNITPMFQEKENYDEIIHYLSADALYNGALKSYDGVFGALNRDTSIESGSSPSISYVAPNFPCRTINVINVQASNDTGESDSDPDLARYFPTTTLTVSGQPQQGFANLVAAAQSPGFIDSKNNRFILNSYFLIQNTLSSIAALTNAGATVLSYSDPTGLVGLGKGLSTFQTLIVDAGFVSASATSNTMALPNATTPAFFAEFRPAINQQPDWLGNVKRLDATFNSQGVYVYDDKNGNAGIASDGRIAPCAVTFWTDTTKLGTLTPCTSGLADGRSTLLGGAGQNIPGYVFNGGGNPGRYNASGQRQIYYDSIPSSGSLIPSLAALDADNAAGTFNATTNAERTELSTPLNCPTTASDTTCQALLLYARGFAVGSTAAPASDLSKVVGRPWMLGAVLHSRPVAFSYGARSGYTTTNPDIRLLFGSSDGLLHMVKNAVGATASGAEAWAMMPKAVMGTLKTQRDNGYSSPNNLGFPYGVDGAVSVLAIDRGKTTTATCPAAPLPADGVVDSNNPCDHAYAFFGLRRGGSNYFGIDITNPDVPKMMWRIGKDGLYSANYSSAPGLVSGSAAWFAELGQSFSTPVIGKMLVQLTGDAAPVSHPVLLFGGGYNGSVNGTKIGKDLNNSRANGTTVPQVGQNDTIGNAIYVVEATTGELIWKANQSTGSTSTYSATARAFSHPLMQDGIPSDVTAVDTDGDGYIDRLYVGDTGGHVWRADFPLPSGTTTGDGRSLWTISLLASLGRHAYSSATLANDRRFLTPPDYVPVRDPKTLTAYDAVVIGSGDREDPFNTNDPRSNGTNNYVYVLRDADTVSGKTVAATDVTGVVTSESDSRLLTASKLTTLANCPEGSASCAASTILAGGFQQAFTDYGEKMTSAPITTNGVIVFTTFVPPPIVTASTATCGPTEGFSKIYAEYLDNGNFYAPLQFGLDGNGDARSETAASPGMAGDVNALGSTTLTTNAQTLNVGLTPYYRVFWRESRGDEEVPPVPIPSTP